MIDPPATRRALWSAPAAGASLGLVLAAVAWPLLGWPLAGWAGGALGLALAIGLAHSAWRSRFGPRQWLLAAGLTALFAAVGVMLVGTLVALATGQAGAGRRAAGVAAGVAALAAAAAAWREHKRLADDRHPWWGTVLDAHSGRVGSPVGSPSQAGRDLIWLAPAIGVNLPLLMELSGVATLRWLIALAAVAATAVAHIAWHRAGPLAGRAFAAMNRERQMGRRFEHRDIEALDALRRGEAAPVPRGLQIEGSRGRRVVRAVLQLAAGLGLVGGLTIGAVEAWPAWQQARAFADYRPVDVLVQSVALTAQRQEWVGEGVVEGVAVSFRPHELDALLGAPPAVAEPALGEVRARLPLRGAALWNPAVARRLLPAQSKAESVWATARFAFGLAAALLAVGVLALGADRALARGGPPRR